MKVALSGGPALTLCDSCGGSGGTWGPDDTIVFSAASAERTRDLFRVPAAGGTPTVLTKPDSAKGETAHDWPEFLPGGKALLFAIATSNNWDNAQIAALNLQSGEQKILVQGGSFPRYAPTGHLVYYRAGTVMAVPFDLDRLEVAGAPAPVLEGIMPTLTAPGLPTGTGAAQFAFSQTGSLAYIAGLRTAERTLVWVDRKGAVEPLGAPPRAYARPALSPDGRRIVVGIVGQTTDIWIYDIARSTLTRLTFEGNNLRPVWTPDGMRIVFPSERGGSPGLFWKLADGTGVEEQLTNDKLFGGLTSISPDGKLAFGSTVAGGGEDDIAIFELQGERKITVFLKTPFDEGNPAVSPDGRWVAYLSQESGRAEIYVRPFPGPGGKWQISTEGGVAPVWARNGRELFYASSPTGKLMAVDIRTEPTFQAGTPRVVLDEGFRLTAGAQGANYDVSLDGQRFLMVQGSDANLTQLNVVLNWFEELKRRVPAP
jgi:serine/threonine-protein kinase